MLYNAIIAVFIVSISGMFALVFGQTPSAVIKPTYTSGDVASISQTKLSVKTLTNETEIALTDKTSYRKVPAEPFKGIDLTKAATGAFAEIGAGDKVTVSRAC